MERLRAVELERAIRPHIVEYFPERRFAYETLSDPHASQLMIFDHDRPWFFLKFRDRRQDGPEWQPSELNTWPNTNPDDVFTRGTAVEESTYWMDPAASIKQKRGQEYAKFVENPYDSLPRTDPTQKNLTEWLGRFRDVVNSQDNVFPGFYSFKTLPSSVREAIHHETTGLLQSAGFDYLTRVPTWFHVAKSDTQKHGFRFTHEEDRSRFKQLSDQVKSVSPQDRVYSSWLVTLQFWNQLVEDQGGHPEHYVGGNNVFRDSSGNIITYPLSPQRNLWLEKKVA